MHGKCSYSVLAGGEKKKKRMGKGKSKVEIYFVPWRYRGSSLFFPRKKTWYTVGTLGPCSLSIKANSKWIVSFFRFDIQCVFSFNTHKGPGSELPLFFLMPVQHAARSASPLDSLFFTFTRADKWALQTRFSSISMLQETFFFSTRGRENN